MRLIRSLGAWARFTLDVERRFSEFIGAVVVLTSWQSRKSQLSELTSNRVYNGTGQLAKAL